MSAATAATPRTIVVPPQGDFTDDFMESKQLAELAEALMAQHIEIAWLEGYRIRFLWKKKSVESGGKTTLGKCIKPSGIASYFGVCDWVIWLNAPALRLREYTDEQIEALLFHELLHCTTTGDDEVPAIRPHDFEGFRLELDRYGLWKQDLAGAAESFRQLTLEDVR